jgi:hypothetical protein
MRRHDLSQDKNVFMILLRAAEGRTLQIDNTF